jgi:penicillin-binding protein 1A
MLRDAVDLGTGQAIRARFGISADVAGKTGTTQKNTDGWFVLMHPRLVAGAWVGFNDSRVTMRSNYWGEGGHNAILPVGDFFQQVIDARMIDGSAKFPYARPRDSMWDPYMDTAKDFFGSALDWLFGSRDKPSSSAPPRRELERLPRRERFDDPLEQQRLERQQEKDRLMDRLREKREQYDRQQQLERDVYR